MYKRLDLKGIVLSVSSFVCLFVFFVNDKLLFDELVVVIEIHVVVLSAVIPLVEVLYGGGDSRSSTSSSSSRSSFRT